MNLFVDYVQPLTTWIQENPSWSLLITFAISLTESLAIIGSIIPGSVTMTAIGMLAGSGIMRIDLTLLAAMLGAIAGDSLSYFLGYIYSDRLNEIWPFKKYPVLLTYGKKFFEQHGGKSVLIGRFIGPLRSIIPIIAGISHMKQWRFLIANVISAIGWSILYVVPGILIGAASHELSAESTTRLFILILLGLGGIWIITQFIKWLLIRLNSFFKEYLHLIALNLKSHPFLGGVLNVFIPNYEQNYAGTMALLFVAIIAAIGFIIISVFTAETQFFSNINLHVHFFIHSFQTSILLTFFIACAQLINLYTIASISLVCCIWFIIFKQHKTLMFFTSVLLISGLSGLILSYLIISPRPSGILVNMPGSSYPDINLMIATGLYGFFLLVFKSHYDVLTYVLRIVLLLILGINGLGAIYLGDYWISDVLGAYLGGLSICLFHFLIYRKNTYNTQKPVLSISMLSLIFLSLLMSSLISFFLNYDTLIHNHKEISNEFILNESDWWDQQKPILPLYRLNRVGNRISLINIQYEGKLDSLKMGLLNNGWELQTGSFFKNILIKMNNQSDNVKLPLLSQLYANKSPKLVMTYKDVHSGIILVIRIWESNYNLDKSDNPLWIGSIDINISENKSYYFNTTNRLKQMNALTYLLPALKKFTVRRISLSNQMLKPTSLPFAPFILLIKEPKTNA